MPLNTNLPAGCRNSHFNVSGERESLTGHGSKFHSTVATVSEKATPQHVPVRLLAYIAQALQYCQGGRWSAGGGVRPQTVDSGLTRQPVAPRARDVLEACAGSVCWKSRAKRELIRDARIWSMCFAPAKVQVMSLCFILAATTFSQAVSTVPLPIGRCCSRYCR